MYMYKNVAGLKTNFSRLPAHWLKADLVAVTVAKFGLAVPFTAVVIMGEFRS